MTFDLYRAATNTCIKLERMLLRLIQMHHVAIFGPSTMKLDVVKSGQYLDRVPCIYSLFHFRSSFCCPKDDAAWWCPLNLDDPKYNHYKFWLNPFETKLPNAPDMEMYSMYGVGVPTVRVYVYKLSIPADCCIPFQIDNLANGGNSNSCLHGGVYFVKGDETVPVSSVGFMCAKGWHGKTQFNPSGIKTYIREYHHAPPTYLLEGRGSQSGSHVDILGNYALIEDVIRVAGGTTREHLDGDQVHSEIFKWTEKINLHIYVQSLCNINL